MALFKRITLLIFIAFLLTIPVCFANQSFIDETRRFSDPMTENMLLALNDDNYKRFSLDFDDKMKAAVNESYYKNYVLPLKEKIGQYATKELLSIELRDQFTVVTYKASFSLEPGAVMVRTVFREKDGRKYISGFWLDSPKLRN